ncbi:MAG: twin-arginine translocase TatA/TatE family subunit [Bacteroidales bacterium]|nr:twin-arginine translocase TatA/TatE family subunit [Bacteroidales bacterium]
MLIYPLFVGPTELIIILCIVLLIFGGKKIPELMKGVGKGVRSFKEGLNEIDEQVQPSEKKKEEKK